MTGFRSTAFSRQLLLCCLILALILLLVVGCSGLQRSGETPQVEGTPATAVPTLVITPVPATEPVDTPSGPVILRIWLPPQFDPASGTLAGVLLQSRLDQFTAAHPEVKIEVRLKAVEGPGGLLEALSTAGAAAPLVLPDVIALPRPLLETAALKGLIYPFSDQPSPLDDPDWYEYARELGRLQKSTFGLPFAGDALVLVYRPGQVSVPPARLGQPVVGQRAVDPSRQLIHRLFLPWRCTSRPEGLSRMIWGVRCWMRISFTRCWLFIRMQDEPA